MGMEMKNIKRLQGVSAAFLLGLACQGHATTITIPDTGASAFWIDPSAPDQGIKSYPPETIFQTWGNLLTAPSDLNMLHSFTLTAYYEPSFDPYAETLLGTEIFHWSSASKTPIGPPLYQSAMAPLSTSAYTLITFTPDLAIIPGEQYFIEAMGNGAAGMGTGKATKNVHLYLYQSNVAANFYPFGGIAFATSINVLEPSKWAMMLIGFVGLGSAGYRRANKRRLAVLAASAGPRAMRGRANPSRCLLRPSA
jgi:hypothetical protein